MDALELKLSLIEQLKTIDDVKLLTQIKNLISIATEKKETRYPAQMTLDELKEVLKKSRQRKNYVNDTHYANNNKVVTSSHYLT